MTDSPVSIRELETPEHVRELRIEAICERIGWGVVALVLIAALLGLLGPGPLSRMSQTAVDGSLHVDYGLIEHYEAPAELRLGIDLGAADEGAVKLSVSRSFADAITPESVSPIPVAVEAIGDQALYTFKMKDLEQGQGKIVLRFQHNDFGMLKYDIGLEGRESLRITQYILP